MRHESYEEGRRIDLAIILTMNPIDLRSWVFITKVCLFIDPRIWLHIYVVLGYTFSMISSFNQEGLLGDGELQPFLIII